MWYIYVLCDPRESDPIKRVRYVGKTNDLKVRYRFHRYESANTHKARWFSSILKLGLKPLMEVIESGDDDTKWENAEREQIARHRKLGCNLTNATDGGEGVKGMGADARAKIGAAHRGKIMSPESRALMSMQRLGKKHSPEHREKLAEANRARRGAISLANKGRSFSQDHKDKIAASKLGKKKAPPCSKEELAVFLQQGWSYQRISNHFGKKHAGVAARWVKSYGLENLHAPINPPVSNETRQRISAARRAHAEAHEVSAMTREKISVAGKGRKFTEEHKTKISNSLLKNYAANIRQPVSEETRRKMTESHKRRHAMLRATNADDGTDE